MDYINKVELQGIIGRVKDTPPFIDFSLCTSEIYNTANASLIETIWHSVKVLSENVKGFPENGRFAHVIGRSKTSKYCDIEGKEHYEFYIYANNVEIIN